MKKVSLIIAMALLIASLSVSAVAQSKGRYGYGAKGDMMHRGGPGREAGPGVGLILRLKEKLELSAEQVEKLKVINDEVKGQFKAAADSFKAKRDALNKAVESGATEAEIRAAASEIGKAIGDQAVLRAGTKTNVDKILTDAQKAKLEELKKQHKEMRKEEHGEGERKMGTSQEGRKPGRGMGTESMFARIDSNGDGAISPEEFKTHMEQMKERRSGKEPRGRRGPRPAGKPEN
ncbi:MAG: Spy/CpxP family protein refolding chaperone [Planctomycetota bacterium]